ncbi:MAG TPA: T9SS type A sorting domain-containing protein [Ferruginibacter sp.]|nr:T9SS type A sorting domain-containing protein [Ferruginibacter sp.]
MRNTFLIALLFLSFNSTAQLIADPAVEQVSFTDLAGNSIVDTMPLGYIAQLNVPIRNLAAGNGLPAGSCKIKIGLGTKMILAPGFDLSAVNSSQFFQWTSAFVGGQVQLTGELVAPLPANYSAIAKFNVLGDVLEYSTITTNFLVSNHNTQVILSDEDPSNNTSFRQYKIIPPIPIPVNISEFAAVNTNCSLNISFTAENEINVSHFDIETSKDGRSFTQAATLTASNRLRYTQELSISPALSASVLYIRIKSVDRDGTFKYSNTKTVNALCNRRQSTHVIYPNPVHQQDHITIKVLQGNFTGRYTVLLYDMKGGLQSTNQFLFNGEQQFDYPVGKLAAGQYIIKLVNDQNNPVILTLQKQ